MTLLAWTLIGGSTLLVLYTCAGYPLLLRLGVGRRREKVPPAPRALWPFISITVPVYNEEAQIRGTLESLLALDYPADRRQILVVSDASTDATDRIVGEYADRGIELLRLTRRGGKGVAESAATPHLRGEIVVNTDATIRIRPEALKRLIAAFDDPTVGLASGRDSSVCADELDANLGESRYVGYEMWLRALESERSGIVGASGCFYAIRTQLHRIPLPEPLSRDFAAALIARVHGYRAVSVSDAVCLVPRTTCLRREYRRKVRTITRGMETLLHMRHLMNPRKYGLFAWMLVSHKACRWALPWTLPAILIGLALLAVAAPWARVALALAALGGAWAGTGWLLADRGRLHPLLSVPAYLLAGCVAVLHATFRALRGTDDGVWEPTRRPVVTA